MKTLTTVCLIQLALLAVLIPMASLTQQNQNSTIRILNGELDRIEVELGLVRQRLARIENPDHWGLLVNPNRPIDPGAENLKRLVQAYNDPAIPDEEIECMLEGLRK